MKDQFDFNSYDSLMQLIRNRRSVRILKDEILPNHIIDKIIEAARWAPSACNRQGWRFIVVNNPDLKRNLAKHFSYEKTREFITSAPNIIFVFYDKTISPEKFAYIQSASAAIQNILLAIHSLGLGAIWYNSIPERPVLDFFKVPKNYYYVAAIIFGIPEKIPMVPSRKSANSIAFYNSAYFSTKNYGSHPENWTFKDIIELIENNIFATAPEWGHEYENPDLVCGSINLLLKHLNPNGHYSVILPEPGGLSISLLEKIPGLKLDLYCAGHKSKEWLGKRIEAQKINKSNYNLLVIDKNFLNFVKNNYDGFILPQILNRIPKNVTKKMLTMLTNFLSNDGNILLLTENKFSYRAILLFIKSFCYMNHFGPFRFLSPVEIRKRINKDKNFLIEGTAIFPEIQITFKSFLKYFCRILLHEVKKNGQ